MSVLTKASKLTVWDLHCIAVAMCQKCEQARQELEQMLSIAEDQERGDIQENLDFYQANIQGLTQERDQMKGRVTQGLTQEGD